MAERFNPKDLAEYKKFIEAQENISKVMKQNTLEFARGAREAAKAQKDYQQALKAISEIDQKILDIEKELNKASGQRKKDLEKELGLLQSTKEETEQIAKEAQAQAQAFKNQTLSVKNLSVAVGRDLFRAVKSVGGQLSSISGIIKQQTLSYFEQDGVIRRTSVNLGVIGKQQYALRKTIYKTATITQRWGVDAGQLSEMYGSYVDSVGRLIPLSEQASYSLAKMAMGTTLGSQGAAEMAANMEVFGYSIERTAKYVEDVSNMSEKMGVSSGAVLKLLNQNLKRAQTLNFKDGVKGIAKMAALSTKLKMDMGEIMGFAESLYNPEEAIEAAASLQMMGGAFAQMADPLKLMYQGRNNPEQLTKDLANAAAYSVEFNKASGEFKIPAMELQRLRQVSEATGVSMETLAESALTVAKQKKIGSMLSPTVSPEAKEYISQIAQYKEGKGFVITVDGKVKKVSDLTQKQIDVMMKEQATLEKRSLEAQDTMTMFSNFFASFKNLFYSFITGMGKSLRGPLETLMGSGKGSLASLSDKMLKWGEEFGHWVSKWLKPAIDNLIAWGKEFVKKLPGFFTDDKGQFDMWGGIKKSLGAIWEGFKESDAGKFLTEKFNDFLGMASPIVKALLSIATAIGGLALARGISDFTSIGRGNKSGGLSSIFGRGNKASSAPGSNFSNMSRGGARGNFSSGQLIKSGAKNIGKGNILKGGSRLLKGVGKGLLKRIPLVGALASMGLDVAESGFSWETLGRGALSGIGGLLGGALGTLAGPAGTFAGGVGGSMAGDWLADKIFGESGGSKAAKPKNVGNYYGNVMMDGSVSPKGNVIKTAKGEIWHTSPKDYIFASQPGKGGGMGGGNMKVDVSGTIKLDGISDNLLDKMTPAEKNALARMVISRMKDQNR